MKTWARVAFIITAMMIALAAQADSFGTGANQFTIDFVTISGATNPTSGYGIVNNDYRMGVYEITNSQWDKFKNSLGVPITGSPSSAYEEYPNWIGADFPTNGVSWYENAQFINWLNTSTGHHAAYNFAGTQGTGDYTFAAWSAAEAAGGTNLFRHKDAMYYMPTEDEWVKAAYWNGTVLQTHATKAGESLHQGDGISGTGWNYYDNEFATTTPGPWDVGSGSEELSGTYDMMGNALEWTESPWISGDYGTGSSRVSHGGAFCVDHAIGELASSYRSFYSTDDEISWFTSRVASTIPEPATLSLLALGGLAILRRRSR